MGFFGFAVVSSAPSGLISVPYIFVTLSSYGMSVTLVFMVASPLCFSP